MTPFQPPTFIGIPTGPLSPIYDDFSSKDKSQERSNTTLANAPGTSKGVVLTTDTLDVPLESLIKLANERTETSRPTLSPLFRTRYVDSNPPQPMSVESFYEALRERLPTSPINLKSRLEYDESLNFKDRNPDFIALDQSLWFQANVLSTFIERLGRPRDVSGHVKIAAEEFQNLPDQIKNNAVNWSHTILTYLDKHLQNVGPNDPSYDLFLEASNQMRDALNIIKHT